LAGEGNTGAAIALAQSIQEQAGAILLAAPKTNDLVAQWLGNTIELMQKGLEMVVAALRQRADLVEIQYIIEELSGADIGEPEMYSEQVGYLRERGLPEIARALDEADECFA
jgi:hypothetical protein